MKTIWWVIIVLVIAAVAVITLGLILLNVIGRLTRPQGYGPQGPVEHKLLAPDFSLVDLNGKEFRLSDFRGKVVVLDFMATWCGPCRMQMPHLKAVRDKYGDSVIIISISIDLIHDSEETLKEFLKEYPYADWIWARDTANLSGTYGVTAIPTLFIIDHEGYIRFKHVGLTHSSVLIQEIDKILSGGS